MKTEVWAAANTGFESGGVTCKLGALCFYSSSVLVDPEIAGLQNPPFAKPETITPIFMTKQFFKIIACLSIIYSCNNNNKYNKDKVKPVDTFYEHINVDCGESWNNVVWWDTSFTDNITLKIILNCQDRISMIDTIPTESDTTLIRSWHDIEYHVNYSLTNNTIVINKASFNDSLASDLEYNGFLTPPHDLMFIPADSSIIFKTFIGHADTDVGDVYVMQVDKNGKSKVIVVEDPEMGIDD